jgi:NADH-quinone oxidoreductase subunit N
MYMRDPLTEVEIDTDQATLYLVLFLCLYGVVQLGVWPSNLLTFIRQAAAALFY